MGILAGEIYGSPYCSQCGSQLSLEEIFAFDRRCTLCETLHIIEQERNGEDLEEEDRIDWVH